MQWKYDIVVIGAGAAGIAAVKSAWASGCRNVLLIDAGKQMGGVLLQCAHRGFGPSLTGTEYIEMLISDFPEEAEVWLDTTVLSVGMERELVVSGAAVGVRKVSYDQLILATGCLEIPMGFLSVAGTRPKGIYTAGQVQEMLNVYQEQPEAPVVILGSGDLGLILAAQLAEQGIEVAALVERNRTCGGMAVNRKCLETYRIPLICSSTITRIYGTEHISEVEITNQLTGESRRISCRSLLTAVGLRPDRSLLEKMTAVMKKESEDQAVEVEKIAENQRTVEMEYMTGECMATGTEMINMKTSEKSETADEKEYPDWIHICGNCKSVHPMIEAVIKEGKQAGNTAWKNIK